MPGFTLQPPEPEQLLQRVPSPLDPPSGCNFWPRSPVPHDDRMKQVEPPFEEVLPNHWVAACPFCVSERVKAVEPA